VLREQEIGAAVFGRSEEYDTSFDNIVRVNVSELRKRLAHYFQDEGAGETIVMEIPRGAYAPVFYARAGVEEAIELPAAPESALEAATGPAAIVPEIAHPEVRSGLLSRLGPFGWGTGLALALSIGGCIVLAWQNYSLRAQIRPWNAEPVRASLWSEFYASGDDVDIVTADTSFALEEDLLGRSISLTDYLDYSYKSMADDPKLSPDTRAALRLVLDRNNGSIGDFQAAELFMDLDAHSPAVKVAGARSFTPESIKTHSVILIGGRQSNPWVDCIRAR
jgi:hypothetical protein